MHIHTCNSIETKIVLTVNGALRLMQYTYRITQLSAHFIDTHIRYSYHKTHQNTHTRTHRYHKSKLKGSEITSLSASSQFYRTTGRFDKKTRTVAAS